MLVTGEIKPIFQYLLQVGFHVILRLKINVQCVEERMRGVISNIIRMSKQVSYFL